MRAKISTPHRPHHHERARAATVQDAARAGVRTPEAGGSAAAAPAPPRPPLTGPVTGEELELARRNHSAPLEALRWPLTPPGLHYTVVHFDIPDLHPEDWRLRIHGSLGHPLDLTLSEIRRRPRRTAAVTLECAGNGRGRLEPRPQSIPWDTGAVGTAEWTGTPLAPLLAEAGIGAEAVDVVFTGADRGVQGGLEQDYARSLRADEAMAPEVLLAYEMGGQPLPPQHGYPLRLLVPGWYGMASVKWLTSIEVLDRPAHVFQNESTYRYSRDADDPGEPVGRMRVRSLMVPPGMPDFFTRRRTLGAGPTTLHGRAWSGEGPVVRVEVAIDGAWAEAQVEPPGAAHAWQEFMLPWIAAPGTHALASRATDAGGNVQPLEQAWTFQGMGNNAVQETVVDVRA
ncbi:sulfite oxidase [Sinomonas soli]